MGLAVDLGARILQRVARVLIPLPDHDFDVTEVAVPWKLLRRAGHEVVFATERGAQATRTGSPRSSSSASAEAQRARDLRVSRRARRREGWTPQTPNSRGSLIDS